MEEMTFSKLMMMILFQFCQGLNSLQSGLHKQHMKDLFVELCLTVPVRLSSLLPYLPMLMDPLVSALNGSQTLVSQVWFELYLKHNISDWSNESLAILVMTKFSIKTLLLLK